MTDIDRTIATETEARNPAPVSSLPTNGATSRWAFINSWRVAPQYNDRAPALTPEIPGTGSPAARRSAVRRKHQEMFKAWSQTRDEHGS